MHPGLFIQQYLWFPLQCPTGTEAKEVTIFLLQLMTSALVSIPWYVHMADPHFFLSFW
jgi:hypothetical protein